MHTIYMGPGSVTHWVEVRSGAYHDSVTLMVASRAATDVPGVTAAMVAMATPLNLELLAGLGFAGDELAGAGPDDLVLAVRADDEAAGAAARAAVAAALATTGGGPGSGGLGAAPAPRTVGSALRRSPAGPPALTPGLVLVSVPGAHAFVEAMDALRAGRSVMMFSDNVPVEQEVALKAEAAARGLLVMGPDCGTAIIGGVGLGFANVVRPGPVGIVGASGTGVQHLACLLDDAGVGISHALGVGGRDLSAEVGGASTLAAMAALDADPATEIIVVVAKPPDQDVAASVRAAADACRTGVLFALLGSGQPDLTAVAGAVLTARGGVAPTPRSWPSARAGTGVRTGALRGLFAGGTLCDEAMVIAAAALGPIASNIPLAGAPALGADLRGSGHVAIDFGDDALTGGRAHPMLDQRLRLDRLAAEAADEDTAVLLLDVVLGHGAHPDPAAELAPALRDAIATAATHGRELAVVVSLCGTVGDPQGRDRQAEALVAAGASVHLSNADAARTAVALVGASTPAPATPPTPTRAEGQHAPAGTALAGLLAGPPALVTVGVQRFADAAAAQGATVTTVDWRPPVAGTADALARLAADRHVAGANAKAVGRLLASAPLLTGVVTAGQAIPGLDGQSLLHAGPPIDWNAASGPLRGAIIGAALYEGWAADPDAAAATAARGDIALRPCHHAGVVGPMAGIVSPSMPLFALRDETSGATAHCTLNEGLGKVLRYGAYSKEVIDRLTWMRAVLGPLLGAALERHGPVDVRALIAQALAMGDEGHNRNRAGTALLLRELAGDVADCGRPAGDVAAALRFIGGNDHFALNVVMPACKLAADAARDVPGSTMVVAMARNGTDFGVQTAGTGDAWFTAPCEVPDGLYLGGYGPDDANPDIGDSTITETAGLGGFAMAAAPAIVRFVGGEVSDALDHTQRMYEITLAEHPAHQIPILGFRGTPTGIDVTSVVRTGILPVVNTGIAGKVAGTGQVGAGLVSPPMACFTAAVAALADRCDSVEA